MPGSPEDLHGMVPDKSRVALILLDVINDLEFEGAEMLMEHIPPMARRISKLKERATAAGIPSIYVNDNYGKWQSDFNKLIDRCINGNTRGEPLVRQLMPGPNDYFVLKPKHSGFFSTTLEVLLKYLTVSHVIITGIAGNICVLFTANDAFMRDIGISVPGDCCASNTAEANENALGQIRDVLKGDTTPSASINIEELTKKAEERSRLMLVNTDSEQFGR